MRVADNLATPATGGAPPLPCFPTRSPSATRVLDGRMADPLLSSRIRGWNGLTLELHAFDDLDVVVEPPDHVIAVQLSGTVALQQTRERRTLSRTVRPRDVTVTPVGAPTRWRQAGQSVVVLLRLLPAYLDAVAREECALAADRVQLHGRFATRDPMIEVTARRLLGALELEGSDTRLHVDTLVNDLAIHLLQEYTTAAVAPPWSALRLSPRKLQQAIEFIDDNLRCELTLAALAEVVALSPGHFAHAFRSATGVAPHRFVLERRVELGKALLRDSGMPITEIADRVGCCSHSHFSVLFRRITGLTPRQFRAQD